MNQKSREKEKKKNSMSKSKYSLQISKKIGVIKQKKTPLILSATNRP